jgi:hypothetical protein
MSIRKAASCIQALQVSFVPRGARIVRGFDFIMPPSDNYESGLMVRSIKKKRVPKYFIGQSSGYSNDFLKRSNVSLAFNPNLS